MASESLKAIFLRESFQNLSDIKNALAQLRCEPIDRAALNTIYRNLHTLKGSASYLGYKKLIHIAHDCEDLLATDKIELLTEKLNICNKLLKNISANEMVQTQDEKHLFDLFVSNLAKKSKKKIKFDFKVDQSKLILDVITKLKNPILQIISNACDHGIETPEIRKKYAKIPEGTITLEVHKKNEYFIVKVSDDGRGLNPASLKAKAQSLSIKDANTFSEQQILELIFEPGLSTAGTISESSGRGFGMEIVKFEVERLGGTATINSVLGEGAVVTLKIPCH